MGLERKLLVARRENAALPRRSVRAALELRHDDRAEAATRVPTGFREHARRHPYDESTPRTTARQICGIASSSEPHQRKVAEPMRILEPGAFRRHAPRGERLRSRHRPKPSPTHSDSEL